MPDRPILLLDVLNTLVHDPFYDDMPRFFGVGLRQMLADKDPTAWIEFERGEIDEATFLARFFADGREWDSAAFVAHVKGCYGWLEGIEPLLAELKAAGATMHVLSNYPTWWRMIEERLALSRYVPWTFVSCKTGVRKPDPEAYRTPARTLGVAVGDCLLVDDRRVNCEAARAVGMEAIEFAGAERLRRELAARGLLG